MDNVKSHSNCGNFYVYTDVACYYKYKFMYILITLKSSVVFTDVRMGVIIIHHRLLYTHVHCINIVFVTMLYCV